MTETNKLKRIHDIIEKASIIGPQGRGRTVAETWREVFRLPDFQGHELHSAIAKQLVRLDDDVCFVLKNLEMESEDAANNHLKAQLQQVRQGISPIHLAHQWQAVSGNFSPAILTATLMGQKYFPKEGLLSTADIEDISDQIQSLSKAVTESSLPTNVKEALLIRIREIEVALAMVDLFGVGDLYKSTNELLGFIASSNTVSEEIKNPSFIAVNETFAKFFAVTYTRIAKVVALAQTGEYLMNKWDNALKLLGS